MSSINNSSFMSMPTAILYNAVISYLSPFETEQLSAVSKILRLGICADEVLWKEKVSYQLGADKIQKYYSLYNTKYNGRSSWYKISIAIRITPIVFYSNGALEQGEFRRRKLHGLGMRSTFDEKGRLWYKEKGMFSDGIPNGIFIRSYREGKIKEVEYENGAYKRIVKVLSSGPIFRCSIM